MSVYIEGIKLEHFSTPHHYSPLLASGNVSRHVMLIYFLSDDQKSMLQPRPQTVNILLKCCKTEHYCLLT